MAPDLLCVPSTHEAPAAYWGHTQSLRATVGQAYVERRGIPLAVADAAGLRFDPDWAGRPAVLVGVHDHDGLLVSVHGRYLSTLRGQDKMLTVGPGGGVIHTGDGWHAEPLILVEGVFDALSLWVCGFGAVATIGRWAPWLPQACSGRAVWLAFDGNRPGEHEACSYAQRLSASTVQRLAPPERCKDWNTALLRHGRADLARWLRHHLPAPRLHHEQTLH